MARLIIDMGSGNTCKNDCAYVNKMIDTIGEQKWQSEVILKWQLFQDAPPNTPLERLVFKHAYHYALKNYKLQTTASVFDYSSLLYLTSFKIPFVKIANNPKLYSMIDDIPHDTPIIRSVSKKSDDNYSGYTGNRLLVNLACVSQYPARIEAYEANFTANELKFLSDHTVGTALIEKYKPMYVERHYKLADSTGLDAGEFASTVEELLVIDRIINGGN